MDSKDALKNKYMIKLKNTANQRNIDFTQQNCNVQLALYDMQYVQMLLRII